MKKKFYLKSILVILIPLITICTNSNSVEGNASRPDCSQKGKVGKTLEEIGFVKYNVYLKDAQNYIKSIRSDEAVSFPLGLICPVTLEPIIRNNPRSQNIFRAVGYLDKEGNIQKITPLDLSNIFTQHLNQMQLSSNQAGLIYRKMSSENSQAENELNNQTLPAIDLIVIRTTDNKPYLLPNVRFSMLVVDALNAALTKKIKRSSYKLDTLDIESLRQLPINPREEI
jgi:hypothetical protein